MPGLSCSVCDLVPWPGIEPGAPALGVGSLSHWTTREVHTWAFFSALFTVLLPQDLCTCWPAAWNPLPFPRHLLNSLQSRPHFLSTTLNPHKISSLITSYLGFLGQGYNFTLPRSIWFMPLFLQLSHLVMSDSLQPHGLQHPRLPCPSPTPGACSNSCPSSWWCHPTISSSVIPFSSCLRSFPASGSFQMSQFFPSGGQSIAASASVLSVNIQDWFPLGWTGCISLQSKGLSRVFSNTTVQKHQFFGTQLSLWSNSHIHTWLLEKNIALTRQTFVGKVMSLLFKMLSRLVITFLLRSCSQL